jgi:hypothetical protein
MPKATDTSTTTPPPLTSGKTAIALSATIDRLKQMLAGHKNCRPDHSAAVSDSDAALIALCQEFIDLEHRRDNLGEALEPIYARQRVLAAQIDSMSFKTMEGARMIARAAACWAKDVIEDGFAELGGLHGELYFTLVRGLIGETQP